MNLLPLLVLLSWPAITDRSHLLVYLEWAQGPSIGQFWNWIGVCVHASHSPPPSKDNKACLLSNPVDPSPTFALLASLAPARSCWGRGRLGTAAGLSTCELGMDAAGPLRVSIRTRAACIDRFWDDTMLLWIDWGVERSRAVLAHAAVRLAPRASSTLQTSSPFHPPPRQLPTAASSKPRPARAAAPHTPLYRVDGSIDGGGPRRLNSVGRSLDRFGPAALPHHPNRSSSIKMRGGAPQGPAAAVSYQSRTPHTHHSLTTPPHVHPKPHRVGRLQPPCNVRTRDRAEGKEGGRRLLAYRPATSAQRR